MWFSKSKSSNFSCVQLYIISVKGVVLNTVDDIIYILHCPASFPSEAAFFVGR